jgi:hypothetical protein
MKNATYTAAQILSAESFQVLIEMSDLLKYGSWDFRADYDSQEIYDYETEESTSPDPDGYDAWVEDSQVRVIFNNGRSIYEIREYNGQGRDCWADQPTGDDAATAADVAQAIADGVAEVLEAVFV